MDNRQSCTATLILAAVAGLAGASVAQASFPGKNGRIAFVHDGGIYDVRPGGGGERELTREGDESSDKPSYSPDGRRIVMERDDAVIVMPARGGRGRTVANDWFSDPAFSPDGRRVVASAPYEGLVSFDSRSGRSMRRFGRDVDEAPAWSRWNRLAYTRVVKQAPTDYCEFDIGPDLADIYVADGDGSGRRRLTTTFGSSDPDWSPDGRTLVFVRNPSLDRRDMARTRADVRAADSDCYKPIHTRYRDVEWETTDLYTVGADGRNMRRLIRDGHSPVWSPDGKRIAFVRGDWIYTARADGSHRKRLVQGSSPAWQPLR